MENNKPMIRQRKGSAMDTITLTVKICGSIETPPNENRDNFQHGVIDTVLELMRKGEFTVEYMGYQPDREGVHFLDNDTSKYEDCVFASFHLNNSGINPVDEKTRKEEIIKSFTKVFEDKTNRQLEVDSTLVRKGKKQRIIEMSSNWKFYRKQG